MTTAPALRVLVVDHEESDRRAVVRALHELVPTPALEEATNLVETENALSLHTYDCVVLEQRLTDGPCTEFLSSLRAQAPQAAFIVLADDDDAGVTTELIQAGVADCLSKAAFDPLHMRHAVTYAVVLQRARGQAAEAEVQRNHYARRLQQFVERAPMLVSARSLDELAQAGADFMLEVLEAVEACVVLHYADVEYHAARGEVENVAISTWSRAALRIGVTNAGDGLRSVVPLRGRSGEYRGFIALRMPAGTSAHWEDNLLRQLSLLVSVCSDSLVLFAATSRAIRARDDVMAAMSHDLRAPLDKVRSGMKRLRAAGDAEAPSLLEHVENDVRHMTRLVDDLVDMDRLEAGRLQVEQRAEPAHELLRAAWHAHREPAQEKRLQLTVHDCPRELAVNAERKRVLQVFANLLDNALKFTPAGGTIELSAEDDGGAVRFCVQDSGYGIPHSEGERVFTRFWQSDPKTRRELGLGLYIAKGVIQAHGGSLWYESIEGSGTRFFFTLPKRLTVSRESERAPRARS